MAKSKVAYAVHSGPGEHEGRVVIVEAGTSGFRPVEDYDCSPVENRPSIVRRLNKRLGVTEKEASIMVAQSMC
jgi:hypothetical protein